MSRENQTPEEQAMYAERARARNRLKMARRKAKKLAARAAAAAPGLSKTHPTYRRRLPALPGLTLKSEQRAFLAQAVRNTAQVQP